MREKPKDLAEMFRFQQSLLHLVSHGTVMSDGANEQVRSKGPHTEQTRQLEALVRKVRSKAG